MYITDNPIPKGRMGINQGVGFFYIFQMSFNGFAVIYNRPYLKKVSR
jgi:hypothetical protein